MTPPRVFISMGTPYTTAQTEIRNKLQSMLGNQCGVDPRILGINEYPSGNPLHKIREVMSSCSGVIIVAYERKFVEKGLDKRGGTGERPLLGQKYTTPWNHVESAIAYSLDLPIYFICERGVTEEGLIENKADWYVQQVDFTESSLTSSQVVDSIRAWVKDRVEPHAKRPRALAPALARLKISEMTFAELKLFCGMLVAAFLFGVGAGKFVPWLN